MYLREYNIYQRSGTPWIWRPWCWSISVRRGEAWYTVCLWWYFWRRWTIGEVESDIQSNVHTYSSIFIPGEEEQSAGTKSCCRKKNCPAVKWAQLCLICKWLITTAVLFYYQPKPCSRSISRCASMVWITSTTSTAHWMFILGDLFSNGSG